jgi:hypothetical protein
MKQNRNKNFTKKCDSQLVRMILGHNIERKEKGRGQGKFCWQELRRV